LSLNNESYRQAVRWKVCAHCIDLGEDGRCTLTGDRQCGVELYLDKIVEVVHSIESTRIQDYVNALRERVCAQCKNQNPDGTCRVRRDLDCGLDRYFALVVEAIEEADGGLKPAP
jgi:hypothetical protein